MSRVVLAVTARLPAAAAHSHALAQLARGFARRTEATDLWYRAPWNAPPGVARAYGMAPEFGERAFRDVELLVRPSVCPREPLPPLQRTIGALLLDRAARPGLADLWLTLTPLLAYLLARRGLTVVYEEHRRPTRVERRLLSAAARRPSFRGAVAVSGYLRDGLVADGIRETAVAVVPSAVDHERFRSLPARDEARRRLGLEIGRPIVGYVGRFAKPGLGEKGIPELIGAAALLDGGDGESPLLLCVGGPRELVPHYEAIARASGLSTERIRFAGPVPASEVPLWIRACDVVTVPLPPTRFGALVTSPLKVPEYMAAGVPVVASDLPTTRTILRDGENAVLVESGSPEALAAGIRRLLADRDLGRRLAEQARRDVAPMTWERRAEQVLELAGLEPYQATPT